MSIGDVDWDTSDIEDDGDSGGDSSSGDDDLDGAGLGGLSWDALPGVPDALRNLGSDAKDLLRRPESFILGTVASWVVTQFFIRPVQYLISQIRQAVDALLGAMSLAYSSTANGVEPAAEQLVNIPSLISQPIEQGLTDMGLAAPIASGFVAVVGLVLFWTIAIVVGRVIVDAIPGGGGLFR